VIGILLAIRVLTLGTPDPARPELSIGNALGFMWNPDFGSLGRADVWLRAAGQIFFTLSVGIGVILTYASYLRKEDDVTLSGLSAASTNEFCEVVLGGSIVVPAAFVFLGPVLAGEVASGSIFNLGFVTMPLIFGQIPAGFLFSGLWFLLLFLAGITSSVSLIQPAVAFLEDELGWGRKRATLVLAGVSFLACQPVVLFMHRGVLGELDFWGGNLFLILFATVEVILFSWVYGLGRGWKEMHAGAELRVPAAYRFVIKYVTPLYLLVLIGVWTYQEFWGTLLMRGVAEADRPYIWGARALVFALWAGLALLVRSAWRRGRRREARA
jgi:SNF family Na+-dependent transporter